MNRYRNRDWMGLRSGHRDLAVSTIPRFPVFVVQLNFLHFYPRDWQPEGVLRTADSKQLEEQLCSTNFFKAAVVHCA